MSHQAEALVLHCIDFRFIHGIVHWLKDQGLIDRYDDVALAGAAKNLADPDKASDRDVILRQLKISHELHAIKRVILINHRDCGAYGHIFSDRAQEYERHTGDLRQAKNMIEKKFPGLSVTCALADLQSAGNIAFETIN